MNLYYPVFICGALRSGSTVLRLMLDHHPMIDNPGEFDFMFDLISDDGIFPDAQIYHNWLALNRIYQAKNLNIDISLTTRSLIVSFAEQLKHPDTVLSLNVHRHFDRIPYVFPNAKYVHLLRDPRDVAKSCVGMGWAGNVYYGVDSWLDTEGSWDKLEKSLRPEQILTIYYEALITAPEATLSRICYFVGVPYSSSMLDYTGNSTYSKPDPALIRQWRTALNEREVQNIESKAADLMVIRGFDLSDYQVRKPNIIDKITLALQNKWFKLASGINRYGFRLFFLAKLAQILGMDNLYKRVVIEKNLIDIKHLK